MDEQMVAVRRPGLRYLSRGIRAGHTADPVQLQYLFPGLEYAPLADALREWYSVLIPPNSAMDSVI